MIQTVDSLSKQTVRSLFHRSKLTLNLGSTMVGGLWLETNRVTDPYLRPLLVRHIISNAHIHRALFIMIF